ncbi:hypothetical protein AB9X75_20580, partial [Pseudomonas sp. Env-32]|uniref:hypothetical protein n=1 Tax=Pseudomonas sp. Env-32 TaxID=3242162 RepID=UPI00385DF35C
NVGAGLPAIAIIQPTIDWLIHRNRRQARSHIWISVPGKSLYGTAFAVELLRKTEFGQWSGNAN